MVSKVNNQKYQVSLRQGVSSTTSLNGYALRRGLRSVTVRFRYDDGTEVKNRIPYSNIASIRKVVG